MKVCLAVRFLDFRNAGLGRVSGEVMKGLVKRGHSVRVVSSKGGVSPYSYFLYSLFQVPFKLPRNADVYHAITPFEAMWLPMDRSVVTFHDLFPITHPHALSSSIGYSGWKTLIGTEYFRIAARMATKCKAITAVSEKTREDLSTHLHVDGARTILSGIRRDLIPMPKRDSVFRVGYIGQLDRRKRVHLLIDAFKKSKLGELVIGGTGLEDINLERLVGRDDRIKFLGRVPDSTLVDFYNSLDVFVFPTLAEGYGLPIVEAMACKRPVVVLDDADIPWEVKSRCVIVPELEYVLGNRGYLEGVCQSADIEDNYEWAKSHDWDKAVNEYVKVYEEVLS